MTPVMKWIGGATAAVVLGIGGATLAGEFLDAPQAEAAPTLEDAIPVDEAKLADGSATENAPGDEGRLQQASADAESSPKPDERFVVKRILPIEGPLKYGDWHWDEEGVPDGPLVMTVDLDARVLSVFRAGYEIGAAAVLLGTDEHPTPTGTFPILWKQRHNVSEKYNNAPMPWSMFLTKDGVAIHGGNEVENGYASHGCIGAPDELVSRVFAIAKKGDKVIITRGETMEMGDPIV